MGEVAASAFVVLDLSLLYPRHPAIYGELDARDKSTIVTGKKKGGGRDLFGKTQAPYRDHRFEIFDHLVRHPCKRPRVVYRSWAKRVYPPSPGTIFLLSPQTPFMSSSYLFKLEDSKAKKFHGGNLKGASFHEFPILKGQHGSLYSVRLEPGGIREPHWHPNAWEFDYCISGKAKMTVLSPQAKTETFEVGPGDAVFVPQGHFHYFENAGPDELHFIIAFNTELGEAEDDIGIAASIGVLPHDVLAKVFKVPEIMFADFPRYKDRLVILSKK